MTSHKEVISNITVFSNTLRISYYLRKQRGIAFFSMNYDPSFFLLDKTENRQKVIKISQLNEFTISFEDKSIY